MSTNLPKSLRRKLAALPPESREVSNTRPHTETVIAPEVRATLKGATARAARRVAMLACGCRLCALALNPPLTFAEYARLGLASIGLEHAAAEKERNAARDAFAAEARAKETAERAEAKRRADVEAEAERVKDATYRRVLAIERAIIEARRENTKLRARAMAMGVGL